MALFSFSFQSSSFSVNEKRFVQCMLAKAIKRDKCSEGIILADYVMRIAELVCGERSIAQVRQLTNLISSFFFIALLQVYFFTFFIFFVFFLKKFFFLNLLKKKKFLWILSDFLPIFSDFALPWSGQADGLRLCVLRVRCASRGREHDDFRADAVAVWKNAAHQVPLYGDAGGGGKCRATGAAQSGFQRGNATER